MSQELIYNALYSSLELTDQILQIWLTNSQTHPGLDVAALPMKRRGCMSESVTQPSENPHPYGARSANPAWSQGCDIAPLASLDNWTA